MLLLFILSILLILSISSVFDLLCLGVLFFFGCEGFD
jgi:hypothetical protein